MLTSAVYLSQPDLCDLSLVPPGLLLEPPGPLLTHLYTVYMACSEFLLTRLNPLAERTCFAQVGPVVGSALSARDMQLPTQVLPPLSHPPFLSLALHWHSPTGVLSQLFFPGCSFPGVLSRVFRPGCSFPDVLSIAQRVFFPEIAIHSLARESHPQSLRAPVCSYAPSVARQLRPLWHVICALCGTLSVPAVARHLCPLWAHLHPLGFFLNPLGLFLRTFIPFIWRVLSAFLRA